jgi:hypothetical protein
MSFDAAFMDSGMIDLYRNVQLLYQELGSLSVLVMVGCSLEKNKPPGRKPCCLVSLEKVFSLESEDLCFS